MQDYVGKQIDRYRIIERLGIGGMAVVYKAYDTRLERDVAIKLIRTEAIPQEQHERFLKRFEREAKAQAGFNHRHIVPIYDYGEVEGAPYLVMTHISGGTLKARTGQPTPFRQALTWLIPVADALSYAHDLGVIHRDIKPSNILFDAYDEPILADFGIAKMLEIEEATLTGTGLGVGTPEYMAPEQWQGRASKASDQYALGVVLYELLTGQKPYTADTPVAVALLQMSEPLRNPRELASGIPVGVEKLLYKVLAQNPEDRYINMRAFQVALEAQMASDVPDVDLSVDLPLPSPLVDQAEPISKEGSESLTFDLLELITDKESKPMIRDRMPADSTTTDQKKVSLPIWALWSGVAVILSTILLVALISFKLSKEYSGELATPPDENLVEYLQNPPTNETLPTKVPQITHTALQTRSITSTNTAEPTPDTSPTKINPIDKAILVYVPEGEFIMGNNHQQDPYFWGAEEPAHDVYVNAFWVYQTEVTNEMYQSCVQEQACPKPLRNQSRTVSNYYNEKKYAHYPVIQVNWNHAVAYCQWAGGRLPTEAEWEKAARGTDERLFPWGNGSLTSELASFCGSSCPSDEREMFDDGYPETAPVGSFPAGVSPYGALDMAGNVWEWVFDYFDQSYYSKSPYNNPRGPSSGSRRVIRGGSWFNPADGLRTVCRTSLNPQDGLDTVGFRCIHDVDN